MKYNIKFKSLDSDMAVIDGKIKEFYKSLAPKYEYKKMVTQDISEAHMEESERDFIYEYDGVKFIVCLDHSNKVISKCDADYTFQKFNKEELQFFDSLDFELDSYYKTTGGKNKQDITDWF